MTVYHIDETQVMTIPGPAKINVGGSDNVPTIVQVDPPTVTGLNPDTAMCGDPDLQLIVDGTGFNNASIITFNGHDEPTALLSDTQVRTNVKPSLFVVAATCPVGVRTGGMRSETIDFTFTEPGAARGRKR
jgi:hypothetical protein